MAGRVLSEAEASLQVELDSGKRVKVKAANLLLKFDKPGPAELIAQAQALSETIELELAWEFAPEDEFGFADLARDYFNDKASVEQQAAALFRLYEAPHYFRRAGKGRFRKASAEVLQQALAAIEKKKAGAGADHRLGRRAGRRPVPRPDSRAALPHPVQTRQERARIQGRGGGFAQHAHRAAGSAQARRRHRLALPVPLEALSVRELSQGHGLSRAGGAADSGRSAAGRGAGLFDRRLADHRDRRRAVAAGPGQRHRGAGHPHRRTGPGAAAGQRGRPGGPGAAVHGVHAGPQAHHAARRGGAGLHAGRRAGLPGGVAVCHARRGHAGHPRHRNPHRARADRRQPAPRPARRRGHARMARKPRF